MASLITSRSRYCLIVAFCMILLCVYIQGCSADPADVALETAKKWSSENVERISHDLTDMVIKDNMILRAMAASALNKKIGDMIFWSYSDAHELSEDTYEVIATAYSDIDLEVLGTYRLSLDYNLKIDTREKEVLDAVMDMKSFSFEKRP